ncbi:hypothetical protein BBP40_006651 [Aspergillus hancockii]|nr:hypothetical protein BBP40_006651 [Aspergillus hancockii]
MIIGGRILLGYGIGNFSAASLLNKVEAARKSSQSVNRDDKSYIAEEDLAILKRDIDNEKQLAQDLSWMDLVMGPIERRKTIYSAGTLIAQQVNGIQWSYYFGTIFSKAIRLSDPFLMTLIIFIIQVVAVLCAVFCANKLPRRPLLPITTGTVGVSIFVVGMSGDPRRRSLPYSRQGDHQLRHYRDHSIQLRLGAFRLHYCLRNGRWSQQNQDLCCRVACFLGFAFSLAYAYFCVGEVTGRSMEITRFFVNEIPARKWRDQPFPAVGCTPSEKSSGSNEKNGVGVEVARP